MTIHGVGVECPECGHLFWSANLADLPRLLLAAGAHESTHRSVRTFSFTIGERPTFDGEQKGAGA